MTTYHIHINGLVQGVGFRPFVYMLAEKMGVRGWVSNTNDGVHIEFNATPGMAAQFYHTIINEAPVHAIITQHHIHEIASKHFSSFIIKESTTDARPDLLLTPDISMCANCRREVMENNNRWFHYAFTTCLHCGPRYSIITHLPYDRKNTSMAPLAVCRNCSADYNNVHNRRHYSQTITCNQCAIPMHLFNVDGQLMSNDLSTILTQVNKLLTEGDIIAVKGIGGYLLLCDATNESSIITLRTRKHRPAKPFALLYRDGDMVKADAELHRFEWEALQDKSSPIVLCKLKPVLQNKICTSAIAPGLNKIGIMLPYSPLLLLIANAFGKPLIATSGNISGSPIIHKDIDAMTLLNEVADYILTYDREIVAPQDDSVVQFTATGQKIILRRSRGLAPNYYPNPFKYVNESVLAMGGEIKSAFALLNHNNLFVSQYLGNMESAESQSAYIETTNHLLQLLQTKADRVLIDKHPGYFVSSLGRERAIAENIPASLVQHHKAHFGAVLAENNLLQCNEPVLGIIWDGTGYGDDDQIWGGEIFIYENDEMNRVAHLDYFTQLLGDKMSKEPRLSALSLLKNFESKQKIVEKYFTKNEWQYYEKLIHQPGQLLTSSMGRLIDGLASILGICQFNSYEGEAAMKLEAEAYKHRHHAFDYYPLPLINHRIDHSVMLSYVLADVENKEEPSYIAWKIFCSLAKAIASLSEYFSVQKIAFSGGVFQNELLTELVIELLSQKNELYFHHQLSPNDECIGFGQIACYELFKKNLQTNYNKKKRIEIIGEL